MSYDSEQTAITEFRLQITSMLFLSSAISSTSLMEEVFTSVDMINKLQNRLVLGELDQQRGRERAHYWKHYDIVYIEKDGVKKKHAKCKYCFKLYKADPSINGTSALRKHFPKCDKNPENAMKKQNTLFFKKESCGEGSVQTWKHDEGFIELFVVGELPFKFVENEAFVEYTNALNGKVILPSRHKVSRVVAKYYVDERNKLLAYLSKPTNTVHLTTNTWTSSCQRVNYMVVTVHFIDDDWSHRGEDVGRELLECIQGWRIENVMTMTVDNASSNDKALEYLVKKLPNMYDGGKHFHVRCMAHILNLVVKDGLKEHNYHIDCMQKAIRYIRHSTQRIALFKKCMKIRKCESNRFLCGDCPTRWNSTYEMLKIAVELRDIFFAFEVEDASYFRDLDRVPEHSDFGVCKKWSNFLRNSRLKPKLEILDVDKHLRVWEAEPEFCLMVRSMREKYNKYWGRFDKLNDFMYFAVMLDPTMKSSFIGHAFRKMIAYNITKENPMEKEVFETKVASMVQEVEKRLDALFRAYKERFDNFPGSQEASNGEDLTCDVGNDFLGEFLHVEESNSIANETELKRYLNEPKIAYTSGFDILRWWKQNGIRFPIVSRMAKGTLYFSNTSGRVLDPYRSNLSPPIVEALICTQDWVRKSRKPIIDDIDDILKDDDIAIGPHRCDPQVSYNIGHAIT
ncbi:hypothetical protein OSB04_un000440, partial [Centaurea solstitialis]